MLVDFMNVISKITNATEMESVMLLTVVSVLQDGQVQTVKIMNILV